MLPFVADALETQLRNPMKIVIKPSVLEEAKTAFTLLKVNLDKAENMLATCSLNIGTALKQMISSVNEKQEEKRKFLRECSSSIIFLTQKATRKKPSQVFLMQKCIVFVTKQNGH